MPVFSPTGDVHTIRYLLTSLDPQLFGTQPINYPVAELPFANVSFTKSFNGAGPFSAAFSLEDEQVLNTNWIAATNPGKTFWWVLVDNQVVYGGRILTRTYNAASQQVTITGSDFYGYWSQRLQAADYTSVWAQTGASAPAIAFQILRDAAAVSASLPNLTVPAHGEGVGTKSDPDTWGAATAVTFSAPASQMSTVDSLVQQFIGMGYPIGIDVVTDVALDAGGNPLATCNVCWPRYGKLASEEGTNLQILDLSGAIDLEWHEDASSQATGIVEQIGGGGVRADTEYLDSTAISTNHYPLVEQTISHTGITPATANYAGVLSTLLQGDRDLYAYPQLAPTVTLPIFDRGTGFSLTALPMGDDIGVFNPFERQTITGLSSLPFPPKGEVGSSRAFWQTMRIVRADVTIADQGVSTMVLTLNPPPGNPSPPGYN